MQVFDQGQKSAFSVARMAFERMVGEGEGGLVFTAVYRASHTVAGGFVSYVREDIADCDAVEDIVKVSHRYDLI